MTDPLTFLDRYDLAELERDPYPMFARMRRECPVALFRPTNQWFVSRWDDCAALGTDPRLGGSQMTIPLFGESVLSLDGGDHEDIRRGVDPTLRARTVAGYRDVITRPAAGFYTEKLKPSGRAEAVGDILERISVRAVGDILGLEGVDDDTRQEWFQAIAGELGNVGSDPEIASRSQRAVEQVDEYLRVRIALVTESPDESGLSTLVHVGREDGVPRTYEEVIGTLRVTIMGGFQEPGHAAAAALYGLLSSPEQLNEVRDDLSLLPKAIHEGLRWLSPFNTAERLVRERIEVAGTTLEPGEEIVLLLGSANHDESRYEMPEMFDIHRPMQAHASFGFGRHFCAGHALGRSVASVTLEEMLTRLPSLRLDESNPPLVAGFITRAVKRLPVVWDC
ncbi:cytochrome P450 [Nocardia testacea]|uniref:cytochrome P450 n=1 Tax=Nocardia testacea TaxID=248551 RepID=UPI003A8C765F